MAKDDKSATAEKPVEAAEPTATQVMAETPAEAAKVDEPTAAPTATVKMVRETPMHAGGPVTADVHEDEVAGWLKAGWNKA